MTSHDATTHPPTQQEQPRPRGQAYKTVIYRFQKDSLRFTACSVLTTRQLWLFEREEVTLSAISRTALRTYSSSHLPHMPMNCRYNGWAPTDPQASVGNAPSISNVRLVRTDSQMSAGNGPSTTDVPGPRINSQTRWKRTVNSTCSMGAY